MLYAWWKWLRDRRNRLWVTPMVTALLAVLLAFASKWIGSNWSPERLPEIEPQTIDALLTVIATSMLAVATFSLGILAAALTNASSSATPRATELLMGDRSARDAIGSFMAAFVYAMVAKTALSLGYYGPSGHFVLFVSTVGVLVYLVLRLLLWVRTLSTLGLVGDSVGRLQAVARQALQQYQSAPCMGARPAAQGADAHNAADHRRVAVFHHDIGYLRNLNMQGLQDMAEAIDAQVDVQLRPGAFVDPSQPLAYVQCADGAPLPSDCEDALRAACLIGQTRSYDQDPRFGLIALSEVAQRALSPAVNDPGTAIQVLASMTTVILESRARARSDTRSHTREGSRKGSSNGSGEDGVRYGRVSLPALDEADLVNDGFAPIARDGADKIEVAIRLQKMLALLASGGSPAVCQAARLQARLALQHAELALRTAHDLQTLQRVHVQLFAAAGQQAPP